LAEDDVASADPERHESSETVHQEQPQSIHDAHTLSPSEEQRARDFLTTRTMRFSMQEETAPQLESSQIQPTIVRPAASESETRIFLHEDTPPAALTTIVQRRSEMDTTIVTPLSHDDSRLSGSSTPSSVFVEETMLHTSTSTSPSPEILSPRSQVSDTSRILSAMDRPIFGGLIFPPAGPAEKRHLYLQEKLDQSRSRSTTPIPPVESPRKKLEELVGKSSSEVRVQTGTIEQSVVTEVGRNFNDFLKKMETLNFVNSRSSLTRSC
jgi:hypothetical protein